MKKIFFPLLTLTLCLGWFSPAYAQEPNVSQYYHTPFLTNPGMIGVVEDVNITVNHRNQTVEAGKTYATSSISGYYPIAVGNHQMGVGVSFLSDRVADFMGINGGMLGTAYSIQLSRLHALSLGAQAGFFNRKLNSSFRFTTDSQFLSGSFNADAPTGEVFAEQSRNFMTLTTGLFWQMKDQQGRQSAFAGASIFNFNQPDVGFEQESKLPVSLKATAGLRVFQGDRLSVMPNARWIYQASRQMLNTGSWFRYDLSESIESPQQISLGAWYNSNKAGVFALEYAKSSYLVGLSYDIPMLSDLNTLQQGGIFEVALSLRIGNKPKKQYVTKQAVSVAPPPVVVEPEKEEVEESPMAEPAEPEMVNKPASINRLQGNQLSGTPPSDLLLQKRKMQLAEKDRLVLNKTVRFELSNYDLTADSKEFLDQVAEVFRRNDELKVLLVGYTCNIGTESDNEELSLQRAEKVQEYLVKKGIDNQRIIVKGQGEKEPIASNSKEEGRVQNRRVEFQVLDK